MSTTLIAQRYAHALLESLGDADADETITTLRDWGAWLGSDADAARALTSPVVAPDRQRAVLTALLDAENMGDRLKAFFQLCLEKGRLKLVGEIAEQMQAILDEHEGVARGEGTAAYPLDDELKTQITEKLAEMLNKKPVLTWTEDADLLGGFRVRVGHQVWHASLAHQLDRLGETIRKGVR